MDKMVCDVKACIYFRCASDSCSVVTRLYNECLKYGNGTDNFILITGKTEFELKNVSQ
jgi:hypothetical protein